MQDPEKIREIESLGQEDDDQESQEELWVTDEAKQSGWGGVPFLQAVLCALALLVLVYFWVADREKYQEIAQWYGQEMAQEIQLPQLERVMPGLTPTPEPTASPTQAPPTLPPDSAPPQLV